jgi:hypothetical protein
VEDIIGKFTPMIKIPKSNERNTIQELRNMKCCCMCFFITYKEERIPKSKFSFQIIKKETNKKRTHSD